MSYIVNLMSFQTIYSINYGNTVIYQQITELLYVLGWARD
jgi:hypothetical protein